MTEPRRTARPLPEVRGLGRLIACDMIGMGDSDKLPDLVAGEDRRPMLTWPPQIPIGSEPADVVDLVRNYGEWLAQSQIPKLYIHAEPGAVDIGRRRVFVRRWTHQIEVEVKGRHFAQEDSPAEIGTAIAEFVRGLRKQ